MASGESGATGEGLPEDSRRLRQETLKLAISSFMTLAITPISILMTIWLTAALRGPDLRIIDASITESFDDIELSSTHLEYLRNDRYTGKVFRKFISFGTQISVDKAMLNRSTATELFGLQKMILAEVRSDLAALEHNSAVLAAESPDWVELKDVARLKVSKLVIKRRFQSIPSASEGPGDPLLDLGSSGREQPTPFPRARRGLSREDVLGRLRVQTADQVAKQKTRLMDLGDFFATLQPLLCDERTPDNYLATVAVLNAGDVADTLLPSSAMVLDGKEHEVLMGETSAHFEKLEAGRYIAVSPSAVRVVSLTLAAPPTLATGSDTEVELRLDTSTSTLTKTLQLTSKGAVGPVPAGCDDAAK